MVILHPKRKEKTVSLYAPLRCLCMHRSGVFGSTVEESLSNITNMVPRMKMFMTFFEGDRKDRDRSFFSL